MVKTWLLRLALGLSAAAILAALYQAATWPDVKALAHRNPETTAFIERYQESRLREGKPPAVRWQPVPYERISVHLKRAVVAAEDLEFFFHSGFSKAEIRRAIEQAIRNREPPRGASTITQQLAKNLWLSPSRNPLRKLKEAILTIQLEKHLSKRRILELYLNVAEFGPGIYGAEAAARHYFGKTAAELDESEAALLAASLPRPRTWNPERRTRSYLRYAAEIERRMARATFLWRAVGAAPP
jgi:monofunctional biosynthetic peptidoglycan transglycosylase